MTVLQLMLKKLYKTSMPQFIQDSKLQNKQLRTDLLQPLRIFYCFVKAAVCAGERAARYTSPQQLLKAGFHMAYLTQINRDEITSKRSFCFQALCKCIYTVTEITPSLSISYSSNIVQSAKIVL